MANIHGKRGDIQSCWTSSKDSTRTRQDTLSWGLGLRHALWTLQWGTPYNSLLIEPF